MIRCEFCGGPAFSDGDPSIRCLWRGEHINVTFANGVERSLPPCWVMSVTSMIPGIHPVIDARPA